MKIELSKEEQQGILTKIIDELGKVDDKRFGLRLNPIEKALRQAVAHKLDDVMKNLVDNEEFEAEILRLGKARIQELISQDWGHKIL